MNIFKLIIVEDEKKVRDGLSSIVDWYSLGFSVAGLFEDGDEAIDYLKSNSVDVILTDIKMARISGLELAGYVHKLKQNIEIIILSGYNEFEYAQKAIEYGVHYYILKPTDIEELIETFQSVYSKLDQELKTADQFRSNKKLRFLMQKHILKNLTLNGRNSIRELTDILFAAGLNMDLSKKPCCLMEIKYKTGLKPDGHNKLKSHIISTLTHNFYEDDNELLIIPMQCIKGRLQLLSFNKRNSNNNNFLKNIKSKVNGKCEQITSIVNISLKIESIQVFPDIISTAQNLRKITHIKGKGEKNVIRVVKEYVTKNLTLNTSLENTAGYVNLSPAYLSRLFKQQTGETFSRFLLEKKIEAAQVLLKDPKNKIYEVSELAGYQSPKYFFKVFKAYTGMTPTEYRNHI